MAVKINDEVSKRIHALRFLLIVFVVFIHNGVIDEGVNFAGGTELFDPPLYVVKVRELIEAFTCVACRSFSSSQVSCCIQRDPVSWPI